MELKIKIYKKQRLAYIPKNLFQVLGTRVKAIPNRSAVLLFSEKTTIDAALTSLDIIKADLLHAKNLQQTGCSGDISWRSCPEQPTNYTQISKDKEVTS